MLAPDVENFIRQHMADDHVSTLSGFINQVLQADHERRVVETADVEVIRGMNEYKAEIIRLGERLAQLMIERDITVKDQRRLSFNIAIRFNVPVSSVIEDGMEQARAWLIKWDSSQKVP